MVGFVKEKLSKKKSERKNYRGADLPLPLRVTRVNKNTKIINHEVKTSKNTNINTHGSDYCANISILIWDSFAEFLNVAVTR